MWSSETGLLVRRSGDGPFAQRWAQTDGVAHEGAVDESFITELDDNTGNDNHEGASRANPNPAAAEGGDQETGDNGGKQSPLGRDTAGDGKGLARGRVTNPTVTPANRSAVKVDRL